MNNLLQLTKIIVLFGVGVLLGQWIYITYNTIWYLETRELPPKTLEKPIECPVCDLIPNKEDYTIPEDWTDYKAKSE